MSRNKNFLGHRNSPTCIDRHAQSRDTSVSINHTLPGLLTKHAQPSVLWCQPSILTLTSVHTPTLLYALAKWAICFQSMSSAFSFSYLCSFLLQLFSTGPNLAHPESSSQMLPPLWSFLSQTINSSIKPLGQSWSLSCILLGRLHPTVKCYI